MGSVRQSKVAKLIQKEMAEIFREEGRVLSVGGMITVTVVRVSPDLGLAKVYLSILTNKNKEEVIEDIRSRSSGIRGKLGHKIGKQVRHIPELNFYLDDSLDISERIDDLLKK